MKIINRKARYNYFLLDRIEAGIVLTGGEVKSVRQEQVSLSESFVRVDRQEEVWLTNAYINPYQQANTKNYDANRSRKLLLKKRQILKLRKKMEAKNLTLVPTKMYDKNGKIKVEIALAKGKKKRDKRETVKKRQSKRKTVKYIKGRYQNKR